MILIFPLFKIEAINARDLTYLLFTFLGLISHFIYLIKIIALDFFFVMATALLILLKLPYGLELDGEYLL